MPRVKKPETFERFLWKTTPAGDILRWLLDFDAVDNTKNVLKLGVFRRLLPAID